jgi:putative two-component system response regulator
MGQSRPVTSDPNSTKRLVVLIDDHAPTLRVMSRLLRGDGADVVTFDSGQAALAWLKATPTKPSLILLDIMMPELDGFAVLEQLRLMPEAAGIPVVMISARADEQCQDRSRGLGAQDYWIKGTFDPASLWKMTAKHLSVADVGEAETH